MDDSERVIEAVKQCADLEGVTVSDIMKLPEPLDTALKQMLRNNSMRLTDFCDTLGIDTDTGRMCIERLEDKGYVQRTDQNERDPEYRIALSPIRGRPIPDFL